MEKKITINDLAKMTGLTTRTLRTYLKMNILSGEKIDGEWKFSEEDVDSFLSDKMVKPSIQAKKNAIVYDFLREQKKTQNEICVILDVQDKDAKEISDFFCRQTNQASGTFRFSFEKEGNNIRVILRGMEEEVLRILKEYTQK